MRWGRFEWLLLGAVVAVLLAWWSVLAAVIRWAVAP